MWSAMKFKELLNDVLTTGPSNMKRFIEVAEKLPSDTTLQHLASAVDNAVPMIPTLERILGDGNLKNMEKLLRKIPDSKTLDRLVNALPLLERMPDKATLTKLLDKADSLETFLGSLEGVK